MADAEIVVSSGRRLAVAKSGHIDDWYISYSPRNDNQNAEGTWEEWVNLAKAILEEDEERKSE